MTKAYFDGSCIDNPGKVGSWGFVICDPWIEKNNIIRGNRVTNNVAEYKGLLNLLKELKTLDMTEVSIYSDSKMVCNIVNRKWGNYKGTWKPHRKYKDLQEMAIQCNKLLIDGKHSLKWIPREENVIADQLAEEAYNQIER